MLNNWPRDWGLQPRKEKILVCDLRLVGGVLRPTPLGQCPKVTLVFDATLLRLVQCNPHLWKFGQIFNEGAGQVFKCL